MSMEFVTNVSFKVTDDFKGMSLGKSTHTGALKTIELNQDEAILLLDWLGVVVGRMKGNPKLLVEVVEDQVDKNVKEPEEKEVARVKLHGVEPDLPIGEPL